MLGIGAGLAALVGCRGPTLPPESTAPVLVGAIVPLTGDLREDGEAYQRAFELAVREVNAAGGIGGRPVALRIADSETNMTVGLRRAEELAAEGVVAMLGDASSASTLAIYEQVTGPGSIPQISCVSTSPLLTDANAGLPVEERFFFRTVPPDQFQARAVLDAARTEGACSRTAVLYQDDTYGDPFADALEQTFSGASMPLVARVAFTEGAIDFTSQITALRAAAPDCVVLVMYPVDAGEFLRAWDTLDPAVPMQWIGGDGLYSDGLLVAAGDAALIDGFLATAPATQNPTPQYNAFADRMEGVFGDPPTIFSSNCYDAAALLLLAMASAPTLSGDDIRDALVRLSADMPTARPEAANLAQGLAFIAEGRSVNYTGASGPVDFDEFGDVSSPYVVGRYDAATMGFVSRLFRPEGT
jgi:branched-chain amino acid transport system substrate-binding protein